MLELRQLFEDALGIEMRTRRSETFAAAAAVHCRHAEDRAAAAEAKASAAEARAIAAETRVAAAEARMSASENRAIQMAVEKHMLRNTLNTSMATIRAGRVKAGLRSISRGIEENLSNEDDSVFLTMRVMVIHEGSDMPETLAVRSFWHVYVLKKILQVRLAMELHTMRLRYNGMEMQDGLTLADYIPQLPGEGGPLCFELQLECIR